MNWLLVGTTAILAGKACSTSIAMWAISILLSLCTSGTEIQSCPQCYSQLSFVKQYRNSCLNVDCSKCVFQNRFESVNCLCKCENVERKQ